MEWLERGNLYSPSKVRYLRAFVHHERERIGAGIYQKPMPGSVSRNKIGGVVCWKYDNIWIEHQECLVRSDVTMVL
jgi:hypothetical protein